MKTKNYWMVLMLFIYGLTAAHAQQKQVSGTVTDQDGLPLPGVSVLVVGTTNGTQTDFDGNYAITASVGETLRFSYIGQKTVERTVGASSTINVGMQEDTQALEEVVVTALGIQREKKAIGFAQQTVQSEDLTRTRQTDIGNALAGKVAGVQFLGAPSSGFNNADLRMRGNKNILYIVDGIKLNTATDINPENIQSLSVLKGAAATALYGPLGINGVILIETKKANSGVAQITIDHSTGLDNVYLLPEYQNEYGGGYSQEFNVFNYDPNQHPASWASFDGQPMVEYYADESWGPRMNGQLVRHWDSWIEGDPEFGKLRPFSPNPSNVKDFYTTGVTNNTSLTVTKGGEGYSIRASIANIDKTLVTPNSNRNQIQGNINAELQISQKLKAYTNLNYQERKTKNFPDNGYGNLGSNFNQWWQRQLDIDRLRNYKRNGQIVSWNISSETNATPLYWDSPFFEVYENLNFQDKIAFFGKIGLAYTLNENINSFVEVRKTYNTYDSNNRFGWGGLGQPFYDESENMDSIDEIFGIVNFDYELSDNFDFTASTGFEIATQHQKDIYGGSVGGLTTEGFYSLNTSVDRPTLFSYKENLKRQSIFAKASLGIFDVLYLDGSARLDWQSTAAVNNNRVETFGGSASFVFSNLFEQNDILSFGKLRGSFAQAPRFPDPYDVGETYTIGNAYGSYGRLSVRGLYPNLDLRGGIREEIELGSELKFLTNRIGIDFTYFKKVDKELPVAVTLDGSTGYTSTFSNEGQQTYKGFEVALNLVPIQTENFRWDLTFNVATLERFVDKVAEGSDVNVLSNSWRGLQLQEREGEEWGAIYGRKFARDDNGNMVLTSSGSPVYETNEYLGNVLPDYTGGLINSIKYKNFSLGLEFDFQKGGKFFSVTRMFNNYSGLGIETVGKNELGNPVRDPLTGTGIISGIAVPTTTAGNNSGGVLIEGVDETTGDPASYYVEASTYWGRLFALHERWLYEATYVKLRTVRLDYSFPKSLMDKTPFSNINLGVFANNVWLIDSAIPGIDPSELEGQDDVNWTEGGQSPNARTIGINVRVSF